MEQLKARNSLAEQMAFVAFLNDATIKSGTNSVDNAEVDLVSHDYKDLTTFNLEEGRYFTENESMGGAPVVIGADIADAIYRE